ncbi:MAG: bifunctional methylenetetrahydrofolate dehydrogenase/methenyltetrahydrofolate cyclohydrolase FolD [Pseudomonadota bacterium]
MPATIIDGKEIALKIREQVAGEVKELASSGIVPGLAVVLIGENPASQVYVQSKRTACKKAGIQSFAHDLSKDVSEEELLSLITKLNSDERVHGILVQLPLPSHIDSMKIIEAIDPAKDVDGFHPTNVGLLSLGQPCLAPCTPSGIIHLIESTGINIAGADACVIGRSNIVGKPVAMMLLKKHATVTICHSKTKSLKDEIGRADIVVAALGKPGFIKGSWIKPCAVVIDVGINRLEDGKLVGDVEFDAACERASAITPVPGGVGPMTIAMLLKNTVEAAKRRNAP